MPKKTQKNKKDLGNSQISLKHYFKQQGRENSVANNRVLSVSQDSQETQNASDQLSEISHHGCEDNCVIREYCQFSRYLQT